MTRGAQRTRGRGGSAVNDYCGLTRCRSESNWERSPCRLNRNRMAQQTLSPVRSGRRGHRGGRHFLSENTRQSHQTPHVFFQTFFSSLLFSFLSPPATFSRHSSRDQRLLRQARGTCCTDTGNLMTLIEKSRITCLSSARLTLLFILTTICLVWMT